MNAPFKVETILADAIVSISDLKKNPSAVVAVAREQQVAILNRNRPVAYMISPEVWEYLNDILADRRLEEEAKGEVENGAGDNVEIDFDEYL